MLTSELAVERRVDERSQSLQYRRRSYSRSVVVVATILPHRRVDVLYVILVRPAISHSSSSIVVVVVVVVVVVFLVRRCCAVKNCD